MSHEIDTLAMAQEHVKAQLSYRQMLLMVDIFLQWATEPAVTPENAAKLAGQARVMRQLAEMAGPGWSPPEPERLSLVGFLARECEKENR